MTEDVTENRPLSYLREMKRMKFSEVNKSIKRVDAYEKVTGKAKFSADLFFPNMLYGKVLRSKYPHARIVGVNIKKALACPGVKMVITAEDVPNNEFGVIIQNQQVLACLLYTSPSPRDS